MKPYRKLIQNYTAEELTEAIRELKKREEYKEWEKIEVEEREALLRDYLQSASA